MPYPNKFRRLDLRKAFLPLLTSISILTAWIFSVKMQTNVPNVANLSYCQTAHTGILTRNLVCTTTFLDVEVVRSPQYVVQGVPTIF